METEGRIFMEKQKAVWKRMRVLIGDFDRRKYTFRELVERLMLVMDPGAFLEGDTVKRWFTQWTHMWDLAVAGEMDRGVHLDLSAHFIEDLRMFLAEEIEKLEPAREFSAPAAGGEGS
jgi:hypothetical protein